MNIHVRFLVISFGALTSGAMMGVAGCGSSSSGGLGPGDGGSSSSASSSTGVGSSSSSSSSIMVDAGDGGEADAGDGGHDSGSETSDAGDAGHDSGGEHTDAGDSGSEADAADGSAGDGAANVLSCLSITCELPNQVCCPGFDLDGGNECLTSTQCEANGSDVYECTGAANCSNGEVCCLTYGGATGGGDLAQCMSATACSAADNASTGAVVCQSNSNDCAFLMNTETCQAGSAALLTCQ